MRKGWCSLELPVPQTCLRGAPALCGLKPGWPVTCACLYPTTLCGLCCWEQVGSGQEKAPLWAVGRVLPTQPGAPAGSQQGLAPVHRQRGPKTGHPELLLCAGSVTGSVQTPWPLTTPVTQGLRNPLTRNRTAAPRRKAVCAQSPSWGVGVTLSPTWPDSEPEPWAGSWHGTPEGPGPRGRSGMNLRLF